VVSSVINSLSIPFIRTEVSLRINEIISPFDSKMVGALYYDISLKIDGSLPSGKNSRSANSFYNGS
jgi:hypothetical protein